MYGPRYSGDRLPERTRPNASARCTAPRSATRVGQPSPSSRRGTSSPPTSRRPEPALGARGQRPPHGRGPVGSRQAVGVGAGQQLGAGVDGGAHPGVGGGSGALLRFVDDAPSRSARAPTRIARRSSTVASVDPLSTNTTSKSRVALGGERLERRADAAGLVEHRHDDGQAGLDAPPRRHHPTAAAHSRTAISPSEMPPARPISSTRDPVAHHAALARQLQLQRKRHRGEVAVLGDRQHGAVVGHAEPLEDRRQVGQRHLVDRDEVEVVPGPAVLGEQIEHRLRARARGTPAAARGRPCRSRRRRGRADASCRRRAACRHPSAATPRRSAMARMPASPSRRPPGPARRRRRSSCSRGTTG